MEVEFVSCFEAIVHVLWLHNFISRLEIVDNIAKQLRIYRDNSLLVFFSTNNKYSKGVKLMELKYFVLKKKFKNKECQSNTLSLNL